MLNFSCKKGCMKLCYLGNVVVLLVQLCHYKTANLLYLNLSLQPSNAPGPSVPEGLIDVTREYLLEKDNSSSTVMGTFNSNSGEQLITSGSFNSLECEVENRLSWITKIELEPMMEVSLVLSLLQLHNGQNHYFLSLRSQALKI